MRRIFYIGTAGGVGCSTAAVASALLTASPTQPVLLTSVAHRDDRAPLLGIAEGSESFGNGLDLEDCGLDYVLELVDVGTANPVDMRYTIRPEDGVVLCMRNDYLSLRRAVMHPWSSGAVVVLADPALPITVDDIQSTLHSRDVRVVRRDPDLARSIDAGALPLALGRRRFREVFEAVTQ